MYIEATPFGLEEEIQLSLVAYFKKLRKIYSQVSDTTKWFLWSQDVELAIQQEKALPPSPLSPSVFYDKLQKQQTAIRELSMPSYGAALPPNSAVPTGSLDSNRAELRSRVGLLQEAATEFQESVGAIQYFDLLKQSLEAQQGRLQQFAEVLKGLADEFEWIPRAIGFTWIDIATSYIPTVIETAGILDTKRSEAQAASIARRNAVLAAGRELVNLLAVEAASLDAEAARLRQLDEEAQDRRADVEDAVAAKDAAANEVQRRKTYVDAAELDLQNALDRFDEAKQKLADLRSKLSTVREKYSEPYRSCPNGEAWDRCNHQDLKDEYLRRKENLRRRLEEIDRDISDQERAQNWTANDVANAEADLASAREALTAAEHALDAASQRIDEAMQQLQAAVELANRERWRSRADIFLAENGNDSATVRALVGILGG